ncbi:MAG: hypothetical protein Kow00114_20540 [Kiloniellaceae bacterium]
MKARTRAATASLSARLRGAGKCSMTAGYPVGILPTNDEAAWNVIFASQCIATINLREGTAKTVTHVSEHL